MDKKLTVWQAACIITGYGVGSGIMALPYLVNRTGLPAAALIMAVAFFFSWLMHMMLAELAIGAKDGTQIVSIFKQYILRGRYAKTITAVMFVIVALILICNLAAYIAGGADVLVSWGLPPLAAKVIFYAVAAAIVFFGLKILGVSESISVSVIIGIMLILLAASIMHWNNPLPFEPGKPNELLAFYGMAMMAFIAFFSVPQVVVGLDRDVKKVKKAIFLGLFLNLAFVVVVVLCALAASSPETGITEIAIIGWSAGIGQWAQILGSLFTILAMLTTYWSISQALADIVQEQLSLDKRICWLIATLPSFLVVLFNLGTFLEIMRTAGGLIAILIAFLVPLAFRTCRRENGKVLLGDAVASTPMQFLVVIAFLTMAVGSVVSI